MEAGTTASVVVVAFLETADRVSRWSVPVWALVLVVLLPLCVNASSACPEGCDCQPGSKQVSCVGLASIPSTFSRSPRSLKVTQHRIAKITNRSFRGLEQLERLEITGGCLSEISNDTFFPLRHLKKVDLSHNELTVLPRDAFADCPQLQQLDLSWNPLVLPLRSPLLVSSSLAALDLSFCSLSRLPDKGFSMMPALGELRLRGNHLQLVSECSLGLVERMLMVDADPTVQWVKCATTGSTQQVGTRDELEPGGFFPYPQDEPKTGGSFPYPRMAYTPTLLQGVFLVVAGVCLALLLDTIRKACRTKELRQRNEYVVLGASQTAQLPVYSRDFRVNNVAGNSCEICTDSSRDSLGDVESHQYLPNQFHSGSTLQSQIPLMYRNV